MYTTSSNCVNIMDTPTIAASEAMRGVLTLAERAARIPAAVLITGETGSGKEHVGRAIHQYSPRSGGPWVDVNCAALPDHLVESELFGYERGAFSGANVAKPGLVELADRGTILLDEIGELPPNLQAKLLRVLDMVPYYRLGGVRKVKPDVRVVAATNQDLRSLAEQGRFRSDLYHRLSQITIRVPPLRERKEDIIPMAELFLQQIGAENEFTPAALQLLQEQPWPGNARELRNAITAAVLEADGEPIQCHHIVLARETAKSSSYSAGDAGPPHLSPLSELERESILAALRHVGGNQRKAAELLSISTRTLYRKLKQYRTGQEDVVEPVNVYH